MGVIDNVCALAVEIANDNSHGYSQANRWGTPDYDCSSFIIDIWTRCGVDVKGRGATYTGNMTFAFLQAGFRKVNPVLESLQPGDVLLNVLHHTALYIGNGKMVHAAGSETGGKYGQPGDQTGKEICITNYYDFPWDFVLRYDGAGQITPPEPPAIEKPTTYITYSDADCCATQMPVIQRGEIGSAVSAMQAALSYHGFLSLSDIDGDFGPQTETALLNFQRKHNIEIDGVCGPITWNELMFWR